MYPGAHSTDHPDKPAIVQSDDDTVLTYADLESRSTRLARYLRTAGLDTGSGVAFISDAVPGLPDEELGQVVTAFVRF